MDRGRMSWHIAMVLCAIAAAAYAFTSLVLPKRARENEVWVSEEVTLGGLAMYAVVLGEGESETRARLLAADYAQRGAAGYIDGVRVLGAGYDGADRAENAVERLKEREGLECRVAEYGAAAVRMRITARPGQISALTNLERAVREGASSLNELSFALDRGEAGVLQARRAAGAVYERVEGALEAFEEQGMAASGTVGEGLKDLASGLLVDLEAVLQEKALNGLDFSSKLKYNYLKERIMQIRFMESLTVEEG